MPLTKRKNQLWGSVRDQTSLKIFHTSSLFGTRSDWITKRKTRTRIQWESFWSSKLPKSRNWFKSTSKNCKNARAVKILKPSHQASSLILLTSKFSIWSPSTRTRREDGRQNTSSKASMTKLSAAPRAKRSRCAKSMMVKWRFKTRSKNRILKISTLPKISRSQILLLITRKWVSPSKTKAPPNDQR